MSNEVSYDELHRDLLRANDPSLPAEELETLFWQYFSKCSTWHVVCSAISKNPSISRALLVKCSIYSTSAASNPVLPLLMLEDPGWVRRNINPRILALALQQHSDPSQSEGRCP